MAFISYVMGLSEPCESYGKSEALIIFMFLGPIIWQSFFYQAWYSFGYKGAMNTMILLHILVCQAQSLLR